MKALFPKINNATCFSGNLARQGEGKRPTCRRVSLKNRALIVGQRCVVKLFCELNIYKHESWWFSEKSQNNLMTKRSKREIH
jgi:hypothetical protein